MAGFVELLPQAKLGGRLRNIWVLCSQFFPQTIFTHGKGALVALFRPVPDCVEIRSGIKTGEPLEAVISESNFIRADNPSLLIDPHAGGNVDHVVELGVQVLPVAEDGI